MAIRKIEFSTSFKKAYDKFTKHNIALRKAIEDSISELEYDTFSASLRTHKLGGTLYGLYGCSCGYDCRIVFSIEKRHNQEIILLLDVGTHNNVY